LYYAGGSLTKFNSVTGWHMLSSHYTGSGGGPNMTMFSNATALGGRVNFGYLQSNYPFEGLGRRPAVYGSGRIAAVVYFPVAHTADERARMEWYLATRYPSLWTLPGGHTYKTSPPSVP